MNSNFFLTIWQAFLDDFLTFQNVLTLLTFIGGGAAAIFAWLTNRDKQKLQAEITASQKRLELELKEKEIELEQTKAQYLADLEIAKQRILAELETQKDQREYEQEQGKLERAYQQSEMSVAHQLTAELLSSLIEFTTKQVNEGLDLIKTDTSRLPDMSKRLGELEEQTRNLVTYYKILTGLLDDFHKKYERDRGKTNG